MNESLSLENLEAIEELVWTLNASRGEFALVIVRCNYAQLRDRAINFLVHASHGGMTIGVCVPVQKRYVLSGHFDEPSPSFH